MFRKMTLLAGGVVLLAALPIQAQDSSAAQLYGRGIQAYFSGDLVRSHELLTAAIDRESRDPRAHYFRGLVCLKLNRPEEAQMDFQKGAQLEAGDANVFYDVSKALERVQGQSRLTIEEYRGKARADAIKHTKAVRHARYEAIRSQEARVLRTDVVLTPDSTAEKTSTLVGTKPAAAAPETENPFAEVPAAAAPATEATPVKSSKLFGAFGKAFGEVVGQQTSGVAGAVGGAVPKGIMPGGGMTGPGTPPMGAGGFDPASGGFGGATTPGAAGEFGGGAVPKMMPPQGKAMQTGDADDPFDDDPFNQAPPAPKTKPAEKSGNVGAEPNPFDNPSPSGLDAPGNTIDLAPATKAARPRKTKSLKPKKSSKTVRPAQKSIESIPAAQPAGDNPFLEESGFAPADKAPEKKK
ncbi:MAG: hypothetical protein JW888_01280 [Pirellulales bacterium]|nr:hypothetical protein [Pirellulales bacterium]